MEPAHVVATFEDAEIVTAPCRSLGMAHLPIHSALVLALKPLGGARGFGQFATAQHGAGSLSGVLKSRKDVGRT